jgi:hypothetical protein
MSKNSYITCPKCQSQIDITESIRADIEEKALADARKKYSAHMQKLQKDEDELNFRKEQFETEKRKEVENAKIEAERNVFQKLEVEKRKLKDQLQQEQVEQFNAIQNELNEKSKQLQEFHKAKAEIERLKRENEETADRVKAQYQERLTRQLRDEKEKMRLDIENNINMKLLEKDTVIEQLQNSLKDAQIKAEQGSMQLQGEVQELAIEKWLRLSFPQDKISEVKKGEFGADTIQVVNEGARINCGKIAYESKRTKHWNNEWLDKFKEDIQRSGATVGVLVTAVMPKDMDRAGMRDGIWICSFDEFKTISKILRKSVIDLDIALGSQKNKDDKMAVLYDYVTGKQFENRIQAIAKSFQNMKENLEKERNAMTRIWANREKELEKVMNNTVSIEGELQAIAGNSTETIDMLEELANETSFLN